MLPQPQHRWVACGRRSGVAPGGTKHGGRVELCSGMFFVHLSDCPPVLTFFLSRLMVFAAAELELVIAALAPRPCQELRQVLDVSSQRLHQRQSLILMRQMVATRLPTAALLLHSARRFQQQTR